MRGPWWRVGESDCVRPHAQFVTPTDSLDDFAASMLTALRKAPLIGFDALGALPCVKRDDGLWLEFGVYRGGTISRISKFRNRTRGKSAPLPHPTYGFDSFQGLPETWRSAKGATRSAGLARGAFSLQGRPPFAADGYALQWVVGWFNETLPRFLAGPHRAHHVAFLHVDSDLYSSASTIFTQLGARLRPGTVIVFDELVNYPGWRGGELRAFWEHLRAQPAHDLAVEVLGTSTNDVAREPQRDVHPQSAAVRLVSKPR